MSSSRKKCEHLTGLQWVNICHILELQYRASYFFFYRITVLYIRFGLIFHVEHQDIIKIEITIAHVCLSVFRCYVTYATTSNIWHTYKQQTENNVLDGVFHVETTEVVSKFEFITINSITACGFCRILN